MGNFWGDLFNQNQSEVKKEEVKKESVCIVPKEPITLKPNQRVILTASFGDDFGNECDIKGTPTWTASDPKVVNLLVSSDGRSCDVRPTGIGEATVTVTAQGESSVSNQVSIKVVKSLATCAGIKASSPENF